jgi:hypothetical protein
MLALHGCRSVHARVLRVKKTSVYIVFNVLSPCCRLTLDEDMLLLKSRDELDEGTIFSLDAGSIKDETKQGRRGLYNISVQAAPELYGA